MSRIENYAKFRPYEWISGGEYEKLSIGAGYKGSHADRRCRDLVAAGKLEKEMRNGHIWYRYRPKEMTITDTLYNQILENQELSSKMMYIPAEKRKEIQEPSQVEAKQIAMT